MIFNPLQAQDNGRLGNIEKVTRSIAAVKLSKSKWKRSPGEIDSEGERGTEVH